jgi:hypothetical protein
VRLKAIPNQWGSPELNTTFSSGFWCGVASLVILSRDVRNVPQKICNLACAQSNPGSQKLGTITKKRYYLDKKLKQIVKFAGTAQSSSGIPKN